VSCVICRRGNCAPWMHSDEEQRRAQGHDETDAAEIAKLRADLAEAEEAMDRLKEIVDEAFGLQPVLGWEGLLDVLEKGLHARWKRGWLLGEAVHDLHQLVPPDRLTAARGTTLEAIALINGSPAGGDDHG
jgi:hypothetical protein